MKQSPYLLLTFLIFIFSALTVVSSCKDDDPLTPEELIAQDPQAAWRNCGTGFRFQRDVPDGPCLRCNTEAGYVTSGRNGELCYDPNDISASFARMVLFDSLPNSWWPSDTLYFTNSSASQAEASGNSFGTGSFSTLGLAIDEFIWAPAGCPNDPIDNSSTYSRNGPSFFNFSTNSQRHGLFNGDSFEFIIDDATINEDCWSDLGYVSGYTARDTSFATVYWKAYRGDPDIRGDTLLTSTFIMVEPPGWVTTW